MSPLFYLLPFLLLAFLPLMPFDVTIKTYIMIILTFGSPLLLLGRLFNALTTVRHRAELEFAILGDL